MHRHNQLDGYTLTKLDKIIEVLQEHSEILEKLQSSDRRNFSLAVQIVELLMSPRVSKWIGSGLLTGAGYLLSRMTG